MSRDTADVLRTSVQYVKGVGPRRAADLAAVGLYTIEDLLLTLPRRYEDREHLQPIATVKPDEIASIIGEVRSCGLRTTRRPGFCIFEMVVEDQSSGVRATFLNQPFLKDVFAKHQRVILYGRVNLRRNGGLQFTNPEYEIVTGKTSAGDDETIHTGRIVPVYEKRGSLTPKMFRRVVYGAIQRLPDDIADPLPGEIGRQLSLPSRATALHEAHFPTHGTSVDLLNRFQTPAQRRLIFEEFFFFQLGLALRRREVDRGTKPRTITVDDRIRQAVLDVLPFRLTLDQRQALKEIVSDLQRRQPMNRLLQGDVGSGKTIVALLAALVAMENGLQVAFMSPTEILAAQHYSNIKHLLKPSRFHAVLLTGTMGSTARREASQRLTMGDVQLVVGTHALVQEGVAFKTLGLVIIDEQHRFGVMQRATLRAKGIEPDVLVMTATPIPRTLALTMYGDLDTSEIRELPPGRQKIKTSVRAASRSEDNYALIRSELDRGHQAYIVYPLVDDSEKVELKAATKMAEHLDQDVFSDRRVSVVHGRMKQDERDEIMRSFASHEIDVLVATTVIEVGIDVPNATVILVEHAERFGLAQLHQLRGRVGRGIHQSYCLLAYHPPLSDQARARLDALVATTDGFRIAERDLELRGPGDFFGTRQSGIPLFRVGDLLRDHSIMDDARRLAFTCLASSTDSEKVSESAYTEWIERYGLVRVG